MIRSSFLIAAAALVSAPAAASIYSATLAAPTSGRLIARDITWNCGPAACQGATDESRPVVLCESLARRAGRIESFLVDGGAMPPAQLDRCNASARPQSSSTTPGK